MYSVPPEFEERLQQEFGDRLRIRWSDQHGEYVVEQKVRRMQPINKQIDGYDDEAIRSRDGYWLFGSVRVGDRMPCPTCHLTMQVPLREFRLISCAYCKLKGHPTQVNAAYFPLDDSLIQYLQRIDPMKDGLSRLKRDVDERNRKHADMMARGAMRDGEAAFNFDFDRIVGIPKMGLSGATKAWADAPVSKTERERLAQKETS